MTLDDDVLRLVQDAVHRERRSMKEVVNDALRRALQQPRTPTPYRLVPHESGLQPGLDAARLNQLADELDDDEQLAALRRGSA